MGARFSMYRKAVCLALPAPASRQTLYLQLEPFKETLWPLRSGHSLGLELRGPTCLHFVSRPDPDFTCCCPWSGLIP